MAVMCIQQLRVRAGITQAALGAQMGVAQCVISAWESEQYLPKSRDLRRLSEALGCSINDLFAEDVDADDVLDEGLQGA